MPSAAQPRETGQSEQLTPGLLRLSLRLLRLHQWCDGASGCLFCLMLVFSPWAFGTTQPWSIWTMNYSGYALGVLLAAKLAVRRLTGYRPPRWGDSSRRAASLDRTLGVLTVLLLGYCLVNVLNARSTYLRNQASFEYHDYIAWLPHSYDRVSSWQAFCNYLALACSFWSLRDWLAGRSASEERAERAGSIAAGDRASLLPDRLRVLLWVLAINGGLLAVEGIAQRLDGTGKLLFLVQARVNPEGESQFGPYAYRSNATQYFNLLWPVALAFWWMLRGAAESRAWRARAFELRQRPLVLVCGLAMAACPLLASSRMGALVAELELAAVAAVLWADQPRGNQKARLRILGFFGAAAALGVLLGWSSLAPRLSSKVLTEGFAVRNTMYDLARPMAAEHPWFGTGPGTFEPLFQMYRIDPDEYWPAQLHNDWLETRITFGWVGMALIAAAVAVVLVRWFLPGGIASGPGFVMLLWVALAGCFFFARYDFPFQIYSILFLFLTLCAVLFTLSFRPGR